MPYKASKRGALFDAGLTLLEPPVGWRTATLGATNRHQPQPNNPHGQSNNRDTIGTFVGPTIA